MTDKTFTDDKHYNGNGDLLASRGQAFRRVGWQINGGVNDKMFVRDEDLDFVVHSAACGGYSPLYIEIGTD